MSKILDDMYVGGQLKCKTPETISENSDRVVTTAFLRQIPLKIMSPLFGSDFIEPDLEIRIDTREFLKTTDFWNDEKQLIKSENIEYTDTTVKATLTDIISTTYKIDYLDDEFNKANQRITDLAKHVEDNFFDLSELDTMKLDLNTRIDGIINTTYTIEQLDNKHSLFQSSIDTLFETRYSKTEIDDQHHAIDVKIEDKVHEYDGRYISLVNHSRPSEDNKWNVGSEDARYAAMYTKYLFCEFVTTENGDVAEMYSIEKNILNEPGRVVEIATDSDKDCRISNGSNPSLFLGVISTKPGMILNSKSKKSVPVALRGRVPCYVVGEVKKGDMLKPFSNGVAVKTIDRMGAFAKALEDYSSIDEGKIEVVIL